MTYRVRFYRNNNGRSQVEEFLEEQRHANQDSWALLIAGFRKLRNEKNHHYPISRPIPGTRLYELRVVATGARVLYCFRPNELVVLLVGVVKKRNDLPRSVIEQAERYRNDYLQRCTHDEDEIDEQF